MTASPLSLAGNAASGLGCCWLAPAVEMAAVASGNWPLLPEPGPQNWTCFPRVAIRSPAVNPRPVHAARDFAVATLRRWGAAQRSDDVALVVSELVTNALRHALPDSAGPQRPSLIRLGLLQPGPCVLCAVADPSAAAPVVKEADVLAESGRGLHVVGTLADVWGYTAPSHWGKVVWAMFSSPAHSATPAPMFPAGRERG